MSDEPSGFCIFCFLTGNILPWGFLAISAIISLLSFDIVALEYISVYLALAAIFLLLGSTILKMIYITARKL